MSDVFKPEAPAAPDYIGAANAQGQANIEAARASAKLSNPNIITPQGQQTVTYGTPGQFNEQAFQKAMDAWNAGMPQGDNIFDQIKRNNYLAGTPKPVEDDFMNGDMDIPTVTQTLSPTGQARFDQGERIMGELGNVAESGVGRVGAGMATPFSMDGKPARTSTVTAPPIQSSLNLNTDFSSGPAGGGAQRNFDMSGLPQGQGSLDTSGVQRQLDYSGASAMPGTGDAVRQRVEDALYKRATSRLDPKFAQQEDNLRSNLVARGFSEGTEAYDRAARNLSMEKNDAYDQAMNSAILAGGQEASREFGMGMQARQQGVQEANTMGQFANTAQNQQVSQDLLGANLANTFRDQEADLQFNAADLHNRGQAQDFSQQSTAAQMVNDALMRRNQAVTQQAQFGNQAQEAQFNQNLTNANLGNTQRQAAVSEDAYLRQLPLNELNALRTGSQVTVPQFQNYSGVNVAPPPIFAGMQAQGDAAMDAYSQEVAMRNALMSAAGTAGAGFMMRPGKA